MAAVVAEMEIVLVLFHDGFLHSYDKTHPEIRKKQGLYGKFTGLGEN
jgi:hypothetical protein